MYPVARPHLGVCNYGIYYSNCHNLESTLIVKQGAHKHWLSRCKALPSLAWPCSQQPFLLSPFIYTSVIWYRSMVLKPCFKVLLNFFTTQPQTNHSIVEWQMHLCPEIYHNIYSSECKKYQNLGTKFPESWNFWEKRKFYENYMHPQFSLCWQFHTCLRS